MRLCSIVVAVVLAQATAAAAQSRPVAVGVKGGVNFAELKFEAEGESEDSDARKGFVGGLFIVWPSESRFALQTEALFSKKGAQVSEGDDSGTIKFNYFEVPVLARISTARSGRASVHVFAGPSFGFRLSAKTKATFDGQEMSEDIDDEVEKFDLGLVAGAGLDIGRFVIDGRYTWGTSNLNKDDTDDVTIKNRVFTLMAGIRF